MWLGIWHAWYRTEKIFLIDRPSLILFFSISFCTFQIVKSFGRSWCVQQHRMAGHHCHFVFEYLFCWLEFKWFKWKILITLLNVMSLTIRIINWTITFNEYTSSCSCIYSSIKSILQTLVFQCFLDILHLSYSFHLFLFQTLIKAEISQQTLPKSPLERHNSCKKIIFCSLTLDTENHLVFISTLSIPAE